MAEYTIQTRTILASLNNQTSESGLLNADNLISQTWKKVFTVPFPIWDETYRATLCEKILKHYYMREICCETIGLWLFYINRKMNEIMPYYNQLYSTIWEDMTELMNDTDIMKVGNDSTSSITKDISTSDTSTIGMSNSNDNTTSTVDNNSLQVNSGRTESNITGKDVDKYSETPQGSLTNVEKGTYLTNARITEKKDGNIGQTSDLSSNTANGKNTTNGYSASSTGTVTNGNDNRVSNYGDIKNMLEHTKGKSGGGSNVELLEKIRNYLINIDMLIIDELEDCFMLLY